MCVWLSVNISGLNISVVKALARNARGPGFKPRLRLDFLPPVTYGLPYYQKKNSILFIFQTILNKPGYIHAK